MYTYAFTRTNGHCFENAGKCDGEKKKKYIFRYSNATRRIVQSLRTSVSSVGKSYFLKTDKIVFSRLQNQSFRTWFGGNVKLYTEFMCLRRCSIVHVICSSLYAIKSSLSIRTRRTSRTIGFNVLRLFFVDSFYTTVGGRTCSDSGVEQNVSVFLLTFGTVMRFESTKTWSSIFSKRFFPGKRTYRAQYSFAPSFL